MGNGSKRESQGLGSVLYTVAIPKLINLNLRQSQLNAFCFSGKRIPSIAPILSMVVQYLFKSLTVFDLTKTKVLRENINYPLRVSGLLISLWSLITLLTQSLKVYVYLTLICERSLNACQSYVFK